MRCNPYKRPKINVGPTGVNNTHPYDNRGPEANSNNGLGDRGPTSWRPPCLKTRKVMPNANRDAAKEWVADVGWVSGLRGEP